MELITNHFLPLTPWFFLLGTVIGSFLNVIILRYEAGKRPLGRSVCPHCDKRLLWYELIPVLSYLLQKGKCRTCGAHLSIQYPLVEFLTGLLFSFIFLHVAASPLTTNHFSLTTLVELVLHLVIWSTLIVITVYDLRTKLIPDTFSATFAFFAVLVLIINHFTLTTNHFSLTPALWINLAAGPLLFLPFFLLWYISDGRWLGIGDGKLALGIGWFLGLSHGGSAIMVSFWIGAIVSLLLIALQRAVRRHHPLSTTHSTLTLKSEIPFGPFLVLGTLATYASGLSIFSYLLP